MSRTITWDELIADIDAYCTEVERGESFVVTRDGVRFAELGAPREATLTTELERLLSTYRGPRDALDL